MRYIRLTFLCHLWILVENVLPSRILISEGHTFDGTGFLKLAKKRFRPQKASSVQFSFRTTADNALLFFIGVAGEYLSLELIDGKVVYRYDLGNNPLVLTSSERYNDGQWHRIQAKRARANGLLKINGVTVSRGRPAGGACGTLQELSVTNEVFIGGINKNLPSSTITKDSFKGCIKDVQLGSQRRKLEDFLDSAGVYNWCRWEVTETKIP